MHQKLVQNFFTTRSWSFWKNHRKGTAKVTPKIEKYAYYIFTENICSACNPMQVVVFCKHVLTTVKRLKLSHFEAMIIP